MAAFEYIKTLKQGDIFRDWIIEVLGESIRNRNCEVRVFELKHASHKVCKYEFKGERIRVIVKFFSIQTGMIKGLDGYALMKREYEYLKKARKIINVPEPITINKNMHCALVSEYIPGRPLSWYFDHREKLKEKLKLLADTLRKLHENTQSYYDKEDEFLKFDYILTHLKISRHKEKEYKRLLEKWRQTFLLDKEKGCMIHNDTTPVNCVFYKSQPFLLDFELASAHGNFVCDLGIVCAELKHYFARKGSGVKAEPYIHDFLKHYSKNNEQFLEITAMLPFYMAYGLLRIAILKWSPKYRNYLLKEARNCLRI